MSDNKPTTNTAPNGSESEFEAIEQILVRYGNYLTGYETSDIQGELDLSSAVEIIHQREQATAKAADRAGRLDELKRLDNDGTIAPDCPNDCEEPDPGNPRENHWHHVVHKSISDRIATLTQQDTNERNKEN